MDSPAGSWAASGAVGSTSHFPLLTRHSDSHSNDDLDNSIDPDGSQNPSGRRGHPREFTKGRGGMKFSSGERSGSESGNRKGSGTTRNGLAIVVRDKRRRQEQPQRHQQPQGHFFDTHCNMEAAAAAPGSSDHSFMVQGPEYNNGHAAQAAASRPFGYITPYAPVSASVSGLNTAAPSHQPSPEVSHAGNQCPARPNVQVPSMQSSGASWDCRSITSSPTTHRPPAAAQRSFHQYRNSDPLPTAGWPSTGNNTNGLYPICVSASDAGRMRLGAIATGIGPPSLHIPSGTGSPYGAGASPVGTQPVHFLGPASPQFLYGQFRPTSSSSMHGSVSDAGALFSPVSPLTSPGLPPDFAAMRGHLQVRYIDSGSGTDSWTPVSSLPSSMSSPLLSQRPPSAYSPTKGTLVPMQEP